MKGNNNSNNNKLSNQKRQQQQQPGDGSVTSSDDENTDNNKTDDNSNNNKNNNIIFLPGPMDIITGYNGNYNHYRNEESMGHTIFHKLIEKYYDSYNKLSPFHRFEIAYQVLHELNSIGCRFIKVVMTDKNNNVIKMVGGRSIGVVIKNDESDDIKIHFRECDPNESTKKISSKFRSMRKIIEFREREKGNK